MRLAATALLAFLAVGAAPQGTPFDSALAALAASTGLGTSQDKQDAIPLRLEFKKGECEEMRFDLDLKMNLDLSSDAFHAKQGMDGKIFFTFRTECKKARASGYLFEAM